MSSHHIQTLQAQLQCAEQDLQTELFLINRHHEGQQDPFAALKCERLYRTIRALKIKIERLQQVAKPQPYAQTRNPTNVAVNTGSKAHYDHDHGGPTVEEERATLDEWNLVNSSHRNGALSGLRLDPTVDPSSENAPDHFLESWTWNGRPLRLVREIQVEGEIKEIRSKVDTIDDRLSSLEKGSVTGNWDEATKERVKAGENLGEARVKAKEAARRMLEEQGKRLTTKAQRVFASVPGWVYYDVNVFGSKAKELKKEYQQQSAISVQSVFRGHLGRRRMKEAREIYDEKIRQESAVAIQCGVRKMLAKSCLHDKLCEMHQQKMEASATVIQTQHRGRLAREQLRFAKSAKDRENIYATMIQSWWKGCMARIEVLEVRGRYLQSLEEVAAIMLQSAWRGYKARKEVSRLQKEQLLKKQEAAAIMFQAAYRGHLARKKMVGIKGQLEKVEKLAKSMDWAERIEAEYYAKQFMTLQQRAACRIQALARGFLYRKENGMTARNTGTSPLMRSPELSPIESLQLSEILVQGNDKENTAHTVYYGEFRLPVARDRFNQDDGVNVSIQVEESRDPYVLRFRVHAATENEVFKRSVDSVLLEKLLNPLFARSDSAADMRTSKERKRDDSLLRWVKTGKPPRRKDLIAWIVDRMWFDQSSGRGLELCLGLQSTSETLKLTQIQPSATQEQRSFDAAEKRPKAQTWGANEKNRPVREAFQVRYIDNNKLV